MHVETPGLPTRLDSAKRAGKAGASAQNQSYAESSFVHENLALRRVMSLKASFFYPAL